MFKYNILLFLVKYRIWFYIKQILGRNNNKIVFVTKSGKRKSRIPLKYRHIKIKFYGINNYIEIHEPYGVKSLNCYCLSDNNKIIIDSNANIIKCLNIYTGKDGLIKIGKNFSVRECHISLQRTINSKVSIGDNCLFSNGIIIRNNDGHTIYYTTTKQIVNSPGNVEIGDHVWVAEDVKILKRSKISDNSVVGAGSIVTKEFTEPNCVLAGIPAKVIKTGINWNKIGTEKFGKYIKVVDSRE